MRSIDSAETLDSLADEFDYINNNTPEKSWPDRLLFEDGVYNIRILPFVPFEDEPNKFYVRLAWHWFKGQAPVPCVRRMPARFGGEQAVCEVCDAADPLYESKDRKLNSVGFKRMSKPQWLSWVLLVSHNNELNDDYLKPYECGFNKDQFTAVATLIKRAVERGNNILDPINGFNIVIRVKGKTFKAVLGDQCAIVDPKEYDVNDVLDSIFSQCQVPDIQMPDGAGMAAAVDTINEEAYGRGAATRSRFDDDEGLENFEMPPTNRQRPSQTAEAPPSQPRPSQRQAPAPAPRQAAPAARPAPAPVAAQPAARPAPAPAARQQPVAPPARKATPAPPPAKREVVNDGDVPSPPKKSGGAGGTSVSDEDDVTDEVIDNAPVAATPIEEEEVAPPLETVEENEEQPPPQMSSTKDIRSKIAALKKTTA